MKGISDISAYSSLHSNSTMIAPITLCELNFRTCCNGVTATKRNKTIRFVAARVVSCQRKPWIQVLFSCISGQRIPAIRVGKIEDYSAKRHGFVRRTEGREDHGGAGGVDGPSRRQRGGMACPHAWIAGAMCCKSDTGGHALPAGCRRVTQKAEVRRPCPSLRPARVRARRPPSSRRRWPP